MEYTKGEWKVDGFRIFDTNGHSVANTGTFSNRKYDEDIANAQLIASAPDLYEALKKFEFTFSNFTIMAKGLPSQMMIGDAIEKARQAIAKAEGK